MTETMFSASWFFALGSILLLDLLLSGDNAIIIALACKNLPAEQRKIILKLKKRNEKLLLSVKNPFGKKPVFVDGIPVSDRKGHGYGTQSIIYLTERLGGNCKFEVEENNFVLMVVI
jgi:sensor histidine kinase regulating citrate/malate metabolism